MMWSRVKGKLESDLMGLGFKDAYMFRPGYIQPMKGIKSKTQLYQALYRLFSWLYPVFEQVLPNQVTTTEKLGQAMIAVALRGHPDSIVNTPDINNLAGD